MRTAKQTMTHNSEQTEALARRNKNDSKQTEALARGQPSKQLRKTEALASGKKSKFKTLVTAKQ